MRPDAIHGTTVLAVRHKGAVALAGDGQVTLGQTVVKHGARKIRRLFDGKVLVGFAGASADAFALLERLDGALKKHKGALPKAAVELAQDWRTDRRLRRLESVLLAADRESTLMVSGSGDVIEPEDGVAGIGSGGPYAVAAARAMVRTADLQATEIARRAMEIASEICIYTNDSILVESLE